MLMVEHCIPDLGILKFMLFGEEFWSVLECILTLFPSPNIFAHSFTVQTGIFNLGANELYDQYWGWDGGDSFLILAMYLFFSL